MTTPATRWCSPKPYNWPSRCSSTAGHRLICGNSLFDPTDTTPVLTRLCPVAEVYHVTLTPALPTVLARCATHA